MEQAPELLAPIGLEVALSRTRHGEWEDEVRDLPPAQRNRAREQPDWTPRGRVRHAGYCLDGDRLVTHPFEEAIADARRCVA